MALVIVLSQACECRKCSQLKCVPVNMLILCELCIPHCKLEWPYDCVHVFSNAPSAKAECSRSSKIEEIEYSLKNSVIFSVPLAELVRPRTMEEFVGQESIIGESSFLHSAIQSGHVPSLVFWGPPGCGKVSVLISV